MSTSDPDDIEADETQELTGIEPEDDDEDRPIIPGSYQPLEFQRDNRRVRDLHSDWKDGILDLSPNFQRGFVWDRRKASRLIESLILNVPIPVIYTSREGDVEYVIDGVQRLTTCFSFIDGTFPRDEKEFRLTSLKVRSDLNKKRYRDLDSATQRAIKMCSLSVVMMKGETHPEIKFEMFERLNSGAEKLNEQELRNCIYRGSLNDLLKELSDDPVFNRMLTTNASERMRHTELVLRFIALYERTYLKYTGGMKGFLNDFMNKAKNESPDKLKEWSDAFKKAVRNCYSIFGERAFRRYKPIRQSKLDYAWQANINKAVYDSQMLAAVGLAQNQVAAHSDDLFDGFLNQMLDDEIFDDAINNATADSSRLRYRIEATQRIFNSICKSTSSERRFSREVRELLFSRNPTCAICGNRIHAIDDAHVDHIVPYAAGGVTDSSNAQLAHRYCNIRKGKRVQ